MRHRKTTAPTRVYADGSGYMDKGDYAETHPAFGVATVTRSQGTPRALFQSDLKHSETITLTVLTAERGRSLMHDWVHPRKTLVEIEMSLAQWGALVSAMGIGSGVPVTLRHTETQTYVDDLPYEPRIGTVVDEAKGAVGKLMERVKERYAVLRAAVDEKQGVKAIREATHSLGYAIDGAESNTEFAMKSVQGAAEHVVSQARADVEAHILQAARSGLGYEVQIPELDVQSAPAEPKGLSLEALEAQEHQRRMAEEA